MRVSTVYILACNKKCPLLFFSSPTFSFLFLSFSIPFPPIFLLHVFFPFSLLLFSPLRQTLVLSFQPTMSAQTLFPFPLSKFLKIYQIHLSPIQVAIVAAVALLLSKPSVDTLKIQPKLDRLKSEAQLEAQDKGPNEVIGKCRRSPRTQ